MFQAHSQVLCTVLGVNIYIYGVILAIAIIVGTLLADYLGVKYFNLKKDTIIDLSPYLVIMGIIGARAYYCLLNYDFYLRFPTEILAIRHGGISIHGAILGGIIGLIIFAKRHNKSILKLSDVTAVGLVLAQAIGRWGNFFNSEAFGLPTNLPWKLYIAEQYRPIPFTEYEYFHPTFLYESILDFLIFIVLLFLLRKQKFKREGSISLLYLILYSVVRIFVESLRIDSVKFVHGMPIAIVVSIGIIVMSLLVIIYRNHFKKVI